MRWEGHLSAKCAWPRHGVALRTSLARDRLRATRYGEQIKAIGSAILPAMSPITKAVILSALSVLLLAAGSCNKREEPAPQPQFRPTATVRDIMTSIVDPESDVLWNAVATIVSLTGTEEREPKTDEEWAAVRRSAVQLVEATNLLRIPGRLVAKHGEKSENPRIELQPETIQRMIAEDPAKWTKLVDGLHDAALPALTAADAKSAKGLFDAGEHMERACESCHQQYW